MLTRCLLLVFLLAGFGLTGCANYQVSGQFEQGQPTFTGAMKETQFESGIITLSLSDGRTCEGTFSKPWTNAGNGVFTCADGQAGSFDWHGNTGTGTLNGQKFIIVLK